MTADPVNTNNLKKTNAKLNLQLSQALLTKLSEWQVEDFCVCAGARNAPLVAQLQVTKIPGQIFSFFHEASAGFFALGRSRKCRRPVAVVVTSGTAVAELLPAVIEAHYQKRTIVVISADRPRRFRGSGSPQSIEQVGIFSDYASKSFDIESIFDIENLPSELRSNGPVHINLCLEEPGSDLTVDEKWNYSDYSHSKALSKEIDQTFKEKDKINSCVEKMQKFLGLNPLVIVGPLNETEKLPVIDFLTKHQVVFICESTAGLHLDELTAKRRILCPEKTIKKILKNESIQSVIRLGGVPTLRFWRDLQETKTEIPVLSLSCQGFSGLARESENIQCDDFLWLTKLALQCSNVDKPKENIELEQILSEDYANYCLLQDLCEKFPLSEMSFVRRLAAYIKDQDLYLGNSLPVREWDLVCSDINLNSVYANRGANGIDGQLSTFLGWSSKESSQTAWCVLGDLTTMYDLAGPWIVQSLEKRHRCLVVINNQGGQIFKQVLQSQIFINAHQINFQDWAKMWGLTSMIMKTNEDLKTLDEKLKHFFNEKNFLATEKPLLIELQPDQEQTDNFYLAWKKV